MKVESIRRIFEETFREYKNYSEDTFRNFIIKHEALQTLNEFKGLIEKKSELHDQDIMDFLNKRWQRIQKSVSAYTAIPDDKITRFCVALAQELSDQTDSYYKYLMPTLIEYYDPESSTRYQQYRLNQLIISDDLQTLIPASLLAKVTLSNPDFKSLNKPYHAVNQSSQPCKSLTDLEHGRLCNHSKESRQFVEVVSQRVELSKQKIEHGSNDSLEGKLLLSAHQFVALQEKLHDPVGQDVYCDLPTGVVKTLLDQRGFRGGYTCNKIEQWLYPKNKYHQKHFIDLVMSCDHDLLEQVFSHIKYLRIPSIDDWVTAMKNQSVSDEKIKIICRVFAEQIILSKPGTREFAVFLEYLSDSDFAKIFLDFDCIDSFAEIKIFEVDHLCRIMLEKLPLDHYLNFVEIYKNQISNSFDSFTNQLALLLTKLELPKRKELFTRLQRVCSFTQQKEIFYTLFHPQDMKNLIEFPDECEIDFNRLISNPNEFHWVYKPLCSQARNALLKLGLSRFEITTVEAKESRLTKLKRRLTKKEKSQPAFSALALEVTFFELACQQIKDLNNEISGYEVSNIGAWLAVEGGLSLLCELIDEKKVKALREAVAQAPGMFASLISFKVFFGSLNQEEMKGIINSVESAKFNDLFSNFEKFIGSFKIIVENNLEYYFFQRHSAVFSQQLTSLKKLFSLFEQFEYDNYLKQLAWNTFEPTLKKSAMSEVKILLNHLKNCEEIHTDIFLEALEVWDDKISDQLMSWSKENGFSKYWTIVKTILLSEKISDAHKQILRKHCKLAFQNELSSDWLDRKVKHCMNDYRGIYFLSHFIFISAASALLIVSGLHVAAIITIPAPFFVGFLAAAMFILLTVSAVNIIKPKFSRKANLAHLDKTLAINSNFIANSVYDLGEQQHYEIVASYEKNKISRTFLLFATCGLSSVYQNSSRSQHVLQALKSNKKDVKEKNQMIYNFFTSKHNQGKRMQRCIAEETAKMYFSTDEACDKYALSHS